MLSNASLETYRASHGGRAGPGRDEKYSLLNSDEHIGVMRKMNRDISDARPDITHQVNSEQNLIPSSVTARPLILNVVSPDPSRFSRQQSRQTPDLYPHRQRCADRSQSYCTHTSNIQTLRWIDGAAASPPLDPLDEFTREALESHQEPHHRSPATKLSKGYPELRR